MRESYILCYLVVLNVGYLEISTRAHNDTYRVSSRKTELSINISLINSRRGKFEIYISEVENAPTLGPNNCVFWSEYLENFYTVINLRFCSIKLHSTYEKYIIG